MSATRNADRSRRRSVVQHPRRLTRLPSRSEVRLRSDYSDVSVDRSTCGWRCAPPLCRDRASVARAGGALCPDGAGAGARSDRTPRLRSPAKSRPRRDRRYSWTTKPVAAEATKPAIAISIERTDCRRSTTALASCGVRGAAVAGTGTVRAAARDAGAAAGRRPRPEPVAEPAPAPGSAADARRPARGPTCRRQL